MVVSVALRLAYNCSGIVVTSVMVNIPPACSLLAEARLASLVRTEAEYPAAGTSKALPLSVTLRFQSSIIPICRAVLSLMIVIDGGFSSVKPISSVSRDSCRNRIDSMS